MKAQINLEVLLAADKVSALEPSYNEVKHLAVLQAVVIDPDDKKTISLQGPAVPAERVLDTLHFVLCQAADALRNKAQQPEESLIR